MLADNLRSVFNVGGVLRTADAAGVEMLHLCGYTARPPHPGVCKSSMGSERFIEWKGWPDARHAASWLKEHGFHLVGLEPDPQSHDYRSFSYPWPLCLVVGNEAHGISPALDRRLDAKVRIPMHGGKSSLNVVVALGIVLYQVISSPETPRIIPPGRRPPSLDLSGILARSEEATSIKGIWRFRTGIDSSFPALALLLHTPGLPCCRIWAQPEKGGMLLLFEPRVASTKNGEDPSCWIPLLCESSRCVRHEPPPRRPLSCARRMAFEAERDLLRARDSQGLGRLIIDSLIHRLLQEKGIAADAALPHLARFLAVSDPAEMLSLAMPLIDRLLRPLGGLWRSDELLYEPPEVQRDDRVERLVRQLFPR